MKIRNILASERITSKYSLPSVPTALKLSKAPARKSLPCVLISCP